MKAIAKDFENYEKCGESPITLINTPFKKVGWTQKKRARKEFSFCLQKRGIYIHEINIKGILTYHMENAESLITLITQTKELQR
jgi:hypothetical protein